ncbi:hypothetical protein C8J57DRAFT_1527246 [Mycena rebaudengoi]|nr:hypothetical protein C8J57DRAFT_1527246 [Mycena rebaudengoi]
MKVPTELENLIQYTTVAASTAEEIVGSFQIPFFSSAASLTLPILKCVEAVRSNRNEWIIMVEQIHEILCAITSLCVTSEIKGALPTALLYDIAKFTETLQKIFTVLKAQQKMGKIKKLFKQPDNAGKLEMCKQELNKAIGMFRVRAWDSTLSQIGHVKKDAKQQHDELMALLNAHPDLCSSDCSSVIRTLLSSGNSSGSFSLLPASPKIFHGCESELKDVVNVLLQNSVHIVILSAGGMGKTSLAIAALHDPQVEAKPFLAPLEPLSYVAAQQTFIKVSDESHDDASIKELLALTGNLPLAVSLIASVAGLEGCPQALSHWKLESTQMLSEGYDQRSSLDISIMLSYTSSRMTTGAQELLSLLSMLPDGLADADLVQAKLPIPDILACKATLIQTALALVGQYQHLKVLVPI